MITPGKLVTLFVGEAKKNWSGVPVEGIREARSAPNYTRTTPLPSLAEVVVKKIDGEDIRFRVKRYSPNLIVVEGIADVKDIFDTTVPALKRTMLAASKDIVGKYDTYKNFEEEYSVFCVSHYSGRPEEFFERMPHAAAFLKSERETLDEQAIAQTLEASIKYGKDDLLVVDWDGAFIFNQAGQFEETISLLELGNLQLLRYRILDFELDRRLNKLVRLLHAQDKKVFTLFRKSGIKDVVRKIIHARSRSIIEFESTERNIKLIGDWYSAKVFSLIEKKFHLDEWRRNIKEKFDTLGDVYTMAAENFSLSFNKRMDIILLLGWFVLLIGWSILLVFDFIGR
ncbi:MAG: hypothetical protein NUV61_04105 [Candidatus Azambacteria bacterium]|nr:hypothetical protein [Candidatus Azambacteria bacterium]